jgi:hypothetical protein
MAVAMKEVGARRQAPPGPYLVRAGDGDRRPNPAELAVMHLLRAPCAPIPPRRRERLDRQLELPFDELDRGRGTVRG